MSSRQRNLFGAVLFLVFGLVSPAQADGQLTLGAGTGVAGDAVLVYGSGFWPNTSGFVFFDHNYDYQINQGTSWKCGYYSDRDCEPTVPVTSDQDGNFSTVIFIPPGKKAVSLGAGTYFIAANLPIGGGSDASAPFKVLAELFESRPGAFSTLPSRGPTLIGRKFAPFKLTGLQSTGKVWWDVNGDFTHTSDEPFQGVWVLPDGSLSACQSTACAVRNPFSGRGVKAKLRVDIVHEADVNRSTEQKVEATVIVACDLFGC